MHKSHRPVEVESESSSFSYSPDFKNFIDENDNGSKLFYVRVEPRNNQNIYPLSNDNQFRHEYKRMSLRRDKGILSKFTASKKKSLYEWKILEKHR